MAKDLNTNKILPEVGKTCNTDTPDKIDKTELPSALLQTLTQLTEKFSMDSFGLSELSRPLTMDFYYQWLENDNQGDMKYLKEQAPLKENAQKFWPQAKSAIVFCKSYLPHPTPIRQRARTALYAQGEDYHYWFKNELKNIADALKIQFSENSFLALTDSSPVAERDLAYRAGLGWFGKNTCLIHPKRGSLFFIGEIYTDLDLKVKIAPLPDFCGTCQRCIEICPTQALEAPRLLNANKCISYLTIEAKSIPPLELRSKIGDWLFGCDLCQTVCPWNQKVFKGQLETAATISRNEDSINTLIHELRFLLTASGKKLQKEFFGTALLRAGPFGLRRNAIIVATNLRLMQLLPEIENLSSHPRLSELVNWSKETLKNEI